MNAPAVFLGVQPGFLHLQPIELFTLLGPVGQHPAGSTVSRQTLEALGYQVAFMQPPQARQRSSHASAVVSCGSSRAHAA